MFEVIGFNWWNFISGNIQGKVNEVEKVNKHQTRLHHQIEFTYFDDLIKIVTHEFQIWPDEHLITASDFSELIASCQSIEDIQKEIDKRRKVISFWDDVFSNYFEDKEAWGKLKDKIDKQVIPIRNKVMHHRLVRLHEFRNLKECRKEVVNVIKLVKAKLTETELEETMQKVRVLNERLNESVREIQKKISPEFRETWLKIFGSTTDINKPTDQENTDDDLDKKNGDNDESDDNSDSKDDEEDAGK